MKPIEFQIFSEEKKMKILYNEETILNRCQDFLSDYAELLNRIGEEIPNELDQLEEELSQYIKSMEQQIWWFMLK